MLSLDIMGAEFRLGYQETIRMVPYQQIIHVFDTRSRISFTWMSYTEKYTGGEGELCLDVFRVLRLI